MSRKRCRKSKIVLRECVESDDEVETNLQEKTSLQISQPPKTNNIAPTTEDERQQNGSPSIQFSVTVDVEKFDEDDNDLIIAENNDEPVSSDNPSQLNENEPKNGYILDRDKTLETVNKIMEESQDIADQSLCIAVKNSLGHFTKSYLNPFETKIHKVLVQWMDWYKSNTLKSSPLMYKCYICGQAWWQLNEFRDHLKDHDTNNELFALNLEEYTKCEANIIAYYGCKPGFQHFHPEGNCPKCGNASETHMKKHRKYNSYACAFPRCSLSFSTCKALKTHEYKLHTSEMTGNVISAVKWKKSCVVCNIAFKTQVSYETHMHLMHSVRSDSVVPMTYKKCQFCKRQYLFNYMQHTCIKKGLVYKCEHCFRKFPSGYIHKTHISSIDTFSCKICNVSLPKGCMAVEHLMKHTDKFIIVKKCILCKAFKVFLEDEYSCKHNKDDEYDTDLCYADPIVIPKVCLQTCLQKEPSRSKEKEVVNRIDQELDNFKDVSVKVEPENYEADTEVYIKREIDVNHEIIDTQTGKDYCNVVIKQEIEDDDESEVQIEENTLPNVFGVKIEPYENIIKDEIEEESEYEDDIIRLNPDFYDETINQGEIHEFRDETNDEMEEDIPGDEFRDETNDEMVEYIPRDEPKKNKRVPKLYICHKCGYEGFHRNYKEHLKNDCLEEDPLCNYTCTKCDMTYKTFQRYLLHFTNHGLKPMACPVCYKVLDKVEALTSHVFVHVRMRFSSKQTVGPNDFTKIRHQCKVCDEEIDKKDFFEHWESHLEMIDPNVEEIHEVINNYDDKGRLKVAIVKKILQCLQSREYTTKHKPGCIICHRHFHRRNDCKRHLIEHLLTDAFKQASIEQALKCHICSVKFIRPENFKQHMRDHAGLPIYKCDLCYKRFSDSSNYAKHKKVHNVNAYTCDICGRKFNAKLSIEKHMVIHETQKPIQCEKCDKVFHIMSMYKKHIKSYHGKKVGQFRCRMCPKRFDSLKFKWEHMWNIHKERKDEADCSACGLKFRRYIDLKMHLKTDHGLTSYKLKKAVRLKQRFDEMLQTPKIVSIASIGETLYVYE